MEYRSQTLFLLALFSFGTRFPAFLSDLKGSEKDYFIQTLEQDSTLSKVFIPDVEKGVDRLSIALKMWVGGITGAKATRKTYSSMEREKEYTLEKRRADFELANSYAKKDEIFRAGVQAATILELIIRKKRNISLEGAKHDSSIWKYVRTDVDSKSVNQEDLLVCSGCVLDDMIARTRKKTIHLKSKKTKEASKHHQSTTLVLDSSRVDMVAEETPPFSHDTMSNPF